MFDPAPIFDTQGATGRWSVAAKEVEIWTCQVPADAADAADTGGGETGVTNTAPHDIVLLWGGGTFTESEVTPGNTVGTIPEYSFAGMDDEGDPLTWSLTTDTSGELRLNTAGSDYLVETKSDGAGLFAGEYTFTLRATDPGGLYVEQEFTITVTA